MDDPAKAALLAFSLGSSGSGGEGRSGMGGGGIDQRINCGPLARKHCLANLVDYARQGNVAPSARPLT